MGGGDDGLIGADVFSDYLIGIDFTAEKLKLFSLPPRPNEPVNSASLNTEGSDPNDDDDVEPSDPKKARGPQDRYIAPEMPNYTRVYRIGHDLLIPTRVGESQPKLFLIDTGAFTKNLPDEWLREQSDDRRCSRPSVRSLSPGESRDDLLGFLQNQQ